MELSDLRRLVDAFEASDWDEVHLVMDGVEIHLSTADHVEATASPPATRTTAEPASVPPAPPTEPASAPAEPARGEPVRSPSPGIFWRSPAPGKPPFVEVGDRVEADSVVCIVELMKLMNRVPAGVAGTVTAVLVANGEPVAKGAALVAVTPDR